MKNNREHYLLDCAGKKLDLRRKAVVMGIVNLTPDSFSDGGTFYRKNGTWAADLAVEHALHMVENGAAIIDIGGESTRPGAQPVSAAEEIRRTIPVITALRKKTDALISIDTYKADVAEAALDAGAEIVNDISGFSFDAEMTTVCAKYHAAAVLMHTPETPQTLQWSTRTHTGKRNVTGEVQVFLEQAAKKAEQAGIRSILLDPGFGFGKSVEENFMLLGNLDTLLELDRPILVGVSRKSFLGDAIKRNTEPPAPKERTNATTAAHTAALLKGAAILRTHGVQEAMETIAIVDAIQKGVKGVG